MTQRRSSSVEPGWRRHLLIPLLILAALIAAACGSRLEEQELRAANGAVTAEGASGFAAGASNPGGGASNPGDDSFEPGDDAALGASGGALDSGTGSGDGSAALSPAGEAGGGGAGGSAGGDTGTGTAQDGGSQDAQAAGNASGPAEEIKLGWVGTTSGVLGALLADQAPGVRAWVANVNESGRLGNRTVRVLFRDDGGDPGKSTAAVRELVEKENVVAMFAPQTVLTGQAWMNYLDENRVPLLGSDGGNPVTDHSDMSFQPMEGADIGSPAQMVATFQAVLPEKKKLALLYCRELNTCTNSGRVVNEYASQVGLEVVYRGENSLAAPDYTSDVIAARNAGAEAVLTYYDHQSTIRIKQAMDRQGFNVPIIGPKSLAISEFLRLGGDTINGVYTAATSQPFCCSPAAKDYMDAMQRYEPDSPYGDFGAGAWLSGIMLEKALANIDGPVTRESLVEGLYALKDETFGGRTPPLTFPRGQKDRSRLNLCSVPLQVKDGKFVAPLGLTFRCATNPPTTVEPRN